MKKFNLIFLAFVFSLWVSGSLFASSAGNVKTEKAPINPKDMVSLQHGAKLFVNYCLGCHSAKYMRYEQLAKGLEIPVELVQQNFMVTTDKPGSPMLSAMTPELAEQWFGAPPPDLTLESRLRGADWVYSYLTGFYEDESRPWGVNNKVFKDVGMPNVMASLEKELGEHEFKKAMGDLANFMAFMADPVKVEREALGVKVLFFLLILLVPVYLLKLEYWKDVH